MPDDRITSLWTDPRREALISLVDVARLAKTYLDQRAREHGTTRAQWGALGKLVRQEGLTQAELAEMLDLQPISLARLIDKLCDQGLVERRPHPTDRRANRLYVTAAGRAAVEAFAPLAMEMTAEIFRGLSADEVADLTRLVDKLRNNVKTAVAGQCRQVEEIADAG